MVVKNDADMRSEMKRRRKRRAINQHLYRGHGMRAEGTTEERMLAHAELHEGVIENVTENEDHQVQGYEHEHKDPMDWEELEGMNNIWQEERRRQDGKSASPRGSRAK